MTHLSARELTSNIFLGGGWGLFYDLTAENLIPEKKIFYSQMLIKDQVTSNFDQFNFRESYQAQSQQDIIRKRLKRYFSYKGKV